MIVSSFDIPPTRTIPSDDVIAPSATAWVTVIVTAAVTPNRQARASVGHSDELDDVVGARLHPDAVARFSFPGPRKIQAADARVRHSAQPERSTCQAQVRIQLLWMQIQTQSAHSAQHDSTLTVGEIVARDDKLRVVPDHQGVRPNRAGQVVVKVSVSQASAIVCVYGRQECSGEIIVLDRVVAALAQNIQAQASVGRRDALDGVVGARRDFDAVTRFFCPGPRKVSSQ
jgi:hypothetical protein